MVLTLISFLRYCKIVSLKNQSYLDLKGCLFFLLFHNNRTIGYHGTNDSKSCKPPFSYCHLTFVYKYLLNGNERFINTD